MTSYESKLPHREHDQGVIAGIIQVSSQQPHSSHVSTPTAKLPGQVASHV